MYLQYYINENGDKVYTTKKESPLGLPTQSAHPGYHVLLFRCRAVTPLLPRRHVFKAKISPEETLWVVADPAVTSEVLDTYKGSAALKGFFV
ncbi:unnamed protein product [Prunus armeniaca]